MKSSSSLVNIIKGNGKTILFPIVYAIEYYDTNALAKLMVTSKTVQFAIRDIPYLFPPSSNTYEKGNNVKEITSFDLGSVLQKKDIAFTQLRPNDEIVIYSKELIEGETRSACGVSGNPTKSNIQMKMR